MGLFRGSKTEEVEGKHVAFDGVGVNADGLDYEGVFGFLDRNFA